MSGSFERLTIFVISMYKKTTIQHNVTIKIHDFVWFTVVSDSFDWI